VSLNNTIQRVKTGVAQFKAGAVGLLSGGATANFFNFFQGRATFFAIVFLIMGVAFAAVTIWGFIHGKDVTGLASVITSMAAFMGALQALMFVHSAKEDWNDYKHRQLDIQEKQQNPTPPGADPCSK
jgi:hypothetical protein